MWQNALPCPPRQARPWDGIRWEQVSVSLDGAPEATTNQMLERFGHEGWELVAALSSEARIRFFFKRPRSPDA